MVSFKTIFRYLTTDCLNLVTKADIRKSVFVAYLGTTEAFGSASLKVAQCNPRELLAQSYHDFHYECLLETKWSEWMVLQLNKDR